MLCVVLCFNKNGSFVQSSNGVCLLRWIISIIFVHKNDFKSKYNAMSILILVDVLLKMLVFADIFLEKKIAENQFHSSSLKNIITYKNINTRWLSRGKQYLVYFNFNEFFLTTMFCFLFK